MNTVVKSIALTDRELTEYHKRMVEDSQAHRHIGKILRSMLAELGKDDRRTWDSIARKAGYDSSLAMHRVGVYPLIDWARGVIDVVSGKEEDASAERTRRDDE